MMIALQQPYQPFLEDQVAAGHFLSIQAAIEAGAARLMLDPDPEPLDEETLDAIDRAEASHKRGESIPWEDAKQMLVKNLGLPERPSPR